MSVYLTVDAHNRARLTGKYHHAVTDKWTGKPVTACSGLAVAEDSAISGGSINGSRWCHASGCRQRYEGGAR